MQFYTLYPVIDLLSIKKTLSGAIFTLESVNCSILGHYFCLIGTLNQNRKSFLKYSVPIHSGDTDFVTLLALWALPSPLTNEISQLRLFFVDQKPRSFGLLRIEYLVAFQLFSILQVCLVI